MKKSMMESFFARFEQIALSILKKCRQIYLRFTYLLFSQVFLWSHFFYNTDLSCCFLFFFWVGGWWWWWWWGGGGACGVHPYKHSLIFQKRLTTRIWDSLTFNNIYHLGPFSQNFRSVSLFLRKPEPLCRGWLEKFCLAAKIQHFLPYLTTQVKS